jgi:hypothetical protein
LNKSSCFAAALGVTKFITISSKKMPNTLLSYLGPTIDIKGVK